MNPIFRFVYWNMNYHLEHHMFPMVPYHALPALHEEMKADTPKPYNGLIEAYREIIPAILRQVKDPAYFVKRELPVSAKPFPTRFRKRKLRKIKCEMIDMKLTNDSYVILIGNKNFKERYYRDKTGWLKVSARGREFRATAEQVLNHVLPVLAGIKPNLTINVELK